MRCIRCFVGFVLLGALVWTYASQPTTPKLNSPERKMIMDVLRSKCQKHLKKKLQIVFEVNHLKVEKDYAFIMAKPRDTKGKKLDYKGTWAEQAAKDGMLEDIVIALMHKKNGKWTILEYDFGPTDWPVEEYLRKHKAAPKEIFDINKK